MTEHWTQEDMQLLAIDPGPAESAFVLYNGSVVEWGLLPNDSLIDCLHNGFAGSANWMACEGVACYGMPVGAETFDTCIWIGRFLQVFGPERTTLVYRKNVKMHLCHSMRAKDSMIRQSLIDRFGPGKQKAIGTKASKGPLYGVKSHCWAALAVAVTWWDTMREVRQTNYA